MNSGGIENYIMNMFRTIDRTDYRFGFLAHHAAKGFFDDEIEGLGNQTFRILVLDDKNALKYFRDLRNLFHSEPFDIVRGHMASLAYFYLGAAELASMAKFHRRYPRFLLSKKAPKNLRIWQPTWDQDLIRQVFRYTVLFGKRRETHCSGAYC